MEDPFFNNIIGFRSLNDYNNSLIDYHADHFFGGDYLDSINAMKSDGIEFVNHFFDVEKKTVFLSTKSGDDVEINEEGLAQLKMEYFDNLKSKAEISPIFEGNSEFVYKIVKHIKIDGERFYFIIDQNNHYHLVPGQYVPENIRLEYDVSIIQTDSLMSLS
ncbi:hypothetical protein TRFO_03355 [Tritrichomonas foetus]|uniref:Uncharacterized protein n=1 Tax=Tritrichomonas foetus TaxID=1144522 RepID=A0A1J4KVP5_9EUKA|nr:hypothetical protein TRFO_03355 [Tritrichomonas foetus]|eukprot:OHT13589.1 hypothetical protein TRFO_03355 [Tritrichomonas foetus]